MKKVFAIAAHPDDIEFVMSGTMMRLKECGYELHYMNIANGCCGSSEFDAEEAASIRLAEAGAAADYLGAKFHPPLVRDLEIFYDRPTLGRLASVIRAVSPSIILTHSPQDYMEDHMNTCRLVVTATFARGMPNFEVDPKHHAVNQNVTIYHAQPHGNVDQFGEVIRPDRIVDVSNAMDRKVEMLRCHESQKNWLDESQGMGSYVDSMKTLLAEVGAMSREPISFAEGWRRHSHMGFCDERDDPLAEIASKLERV